MKEVHIEKANIDFFDFFFSIKSEEENIYWAGHDTPPDYDSLKKWYLSQLDNEARVIFQVSNNEEYIGYVYVDIYPEVRQVELSYAISSKFSGNGYGSKAVGKGVEYAQKHFPTYQIKAYVAKDNLASHRIMEKNNFSPSNQSRLQFLKIPKSEVVMQEYIFQNNPVFIIAEAGVNHNGDINLAKRLIDEAAEAGVDAVKFQTWKTELLVTKEAKQAEYQKENTKVEESQFDMLKRLELSYPEFTALKAYCDAKRVRFLSTPDEVESANFLCTLQEVFKVGSGELTNKPFLRHIGSLNKEIILSTGMGELKEIEDALKVLVDAGTPKDKITVLHANTQYPTPIEDVNLNAMLTIKERLGVKVGYSDHTLGIEVPVAAVALGACVIEKHFTLDKTMDGPDHKASLDPQELKAMVKAIRNIEKALGSYEKKPSKSESSNIEIVRKSIVANEAIVQGELIKESMIAAMRPGTGISPMRWDEIVGTKAKKDYKKGDLI